MQRRGRGDGQPITWNPFGFRLRGFSEATFNFPSTTFIRLSVSRTYCRSLYVRRSSTSIDWLMFWTYAQDNKINQTPRHRQTWIVLCRSYREMLFTLYFTPEMQLEQFLDLLIEHYFDIHVIIFLLFSISAGWTEIKHDMKLRWIVLICSKKIIILFMG